MVNVYLPPLGVQVARRCKHANKLSVDTCDAVAGIGAKAGANLGPSSQEDTLDHVRNGNWNISRDLISDGLI